VTLLKSFDSDACSSTLPFVSPVAIVICEVMDVMVLLDDVMSAVGVWPPVVTTLVVDVVVPNLFVASTRT
jgi:hypothetical protein